jgi:hypothetical protein
VGKPARSRPFVGRRDDGSVYSQHRVSPSHPDDEALPTWNSLEILRQQETREENRRKRLEETA